MYQEKHLIVLLFLQFLCNCLCCIDNMLGVLVHLVIHNVIIGDVNLGKKSYNTGMKHILENIGIGSHIALFFVIFILVKRITLTNLCKEHITMVAVLFICKSVLLLVTVLEITVRGIREKVVCQKFEIIFFFCLHNLCL